jgi:type II secretory ATPase GspE/PulE/Tfp pilus assembly ATPase PilB-like protein
VSFINCVSSRIHQRKLAARIKVISKLDISGKTCTAGWQDLKPKQPDRVIDLMTLPTMYQEKNRDSAFTRAARYLRYEPEEKAFA